MIFAGVDLGSTTTKGVVIDTGGGVLAQVVLPTGADHRHVGHRCLEHLLAQIGAGPRDLNGLVSTGYGRFSLGDGAHAVTEITCHARGALHLFPGTRTVIDVGGQDTKVISVGPGARVRDFAMNDKCAAGTGRFLEMTARILGLRLEEFGRLAAASERPAEISSTCTVFAESEIVSKVAEGLRVEDIIDGVHLSLCNRFLGLLRRLGVHPEITWTGGVAMNRGVVCRLAERLGEPVNLPASPQLVGALGAALIARGLHELGQRGTPR